VETEELARDVETPREEYFILSGLLVHFFGNLLDRWKEKNVLLDLWFTPSPGRLQFLQELVELLARGL